MAAAADCAGAGRPIAFEGIAALDLREPYETPLSDTLIDQVVDLLWERDANPAWYFGALEYSEWHAEPQQIQAAKERFREIVLRRKWDSSRQARIDIDNDGRKEWVLYLAQSVCSDAPAMPVVLTDDRKAIDYAKTALLARHPLRSDSRWKEARSVEPDDMAPPGVSMVPVPDAFESVQYLFFAFEGRTHFALRWLPFDRHALPDVHNGQTAVFLARGEHVAQLCDIEVRRNR